MLQHVGPVYRHLLEPCHGDFEFFDLLGEMVAVDVRRRVADTAEKVLGDRDFAVVEVWAVLPLELPLEGFREC